MSPVQSPMPSFFARLSHYAAARGEEDALVFSERGEDRVVSWARLELWTRRFGRFLEDRGVRPGDVVLILTTPPREQILSFLGALACGAVPSILSFPSIKQSERRFLDMLASVVRNSHARFLLCSAELAGPVSRWAGESGAGVGVLEIPDPAALEASRALPAPVEGAPFFLQFSSGTTGARKGVAVTHEMLARQTSSYADALGLGPADRVANWLPLYHDNGLVGCFLLPMYLGACSMHMAPFEWVEEPVRIFELVARQRATLLWSPNFALSYCARRIAPEQLEGLRLDSLRAFLTGGELVREKTRREFLARFAGTGLAEVHLQVCYGMAENTFVATQTEMGVRVRADLVDRQAIFRDHRAVPLPKGTPAEEGVTFYSCGRAIPRHELRIAGAPGDRQVGEIEILSDCLFEGYVTERGLVRDGVFSEDGWYRSGDLGYLLDGELFVTGRAKDLIIHRGVNLHPEDLQEVLSELPGSKQGRVLVFGLADEEEGTEQIVALLEMAGAADEEETRRRAREAVAAQFGVQLFDVRVWPPGTLLKTTSGKLARDANRQLYLERLAAEKAAGERRATPRRQRTEPRDRWESELVEIWRQVLRTPSVGVTDDLFLELGAGSLSALSAVGLIRRRLGRDVEAYQLLSQETIEGQANLLREEAGSGHSGNGALVTLRSASRSGGANLPLFLAHPAGGDPFSYLALARRLGPEQPVWAFQDPHRFADQGAYASLEEMAAAYAWELETVLPSGPFALGGWSMGGVVAFEMARQLSARGRQPALVVMLDSYQPTQSLRRAGLQAGRWVQKRWLQGFGAGSLFLKLRGLDEMGGDLARFEAIAYAHYGCHDPRVVEKTFPGLCDAAELRRLAPAAMWEHVYRRLQETGRVPIVPGRTATAIRREQRMFAVHHELTERYAPAGTYSGRLTLFLQRGHAEALTWGRFSSQPLDVREYDIRGTGQVADPHIAMMQDENVALYAGDLLDRLAGASGDRR